MSKIEDLSGCPVVFSKLLIGRPSCFWQWFWHFDVDIEVFEVAQLDKRKIRKAELSYATLSTTINKMRLILLQDGHIFDAFVRLLQR